MHSQLADFPSFEQLLHNDKETILAHLESDVLKIKVVVRARENVSEVYECEVKNSDVEGKLSQYFEHLSQLKQYMKNCQNVKVDMQKKVLDLIAKGPTKRSSYILLGQFKLKLVQKPPKPQKETSLGEAEEWIDNLATEIIGIIESKSKTKEKEENMRHFVRRSEMDEALDLLRAQLQIHIEKNRQEITQVKQQFILLENKKALQSVENSVGTHEKQWEALISEQQARKQQFTNVENKISLIKTQLDEKINTLHIEFSQMLKQESQKLHQNLTRQVNIKINQISISFSTKEEIDVVIKKVQNIGSKLESLSFQSTKASERDTLNERLYMQERKLNEIEGKLVKQTSKETNTKSALSQFGPTNMVAAESWVDSACSHFGRIALKQNTITMTSYGNARLFGRNFIKDKPTFHIQINAMANRMSIGVIDTEYKENVIFGEEPNVITYQSDKRSWNGKKQKFEQGEGFRTDETVTVSIDLDLGTILWKVGSTLRYSWQSDDLRNNKIKWVPFVKMFDKGDKISILQ